ncbi:hypothetical protein [Endozoicomonas numazuensis]|uniref:Uncharacterized protein n=1 Tax=Endozoicomonas numazuensis TaxID=1137799 RepID=A0A081NLH9_9GAMM|nr:hypothetical protein [Endozoicomonas numazuensis]KEQ19302.1 hypothetical protein GZ78_04805 [Endozoicomonas numazuensis]
MNDDTVKKLALMIAANCTRNSVLDDAVKTKAVSEEQMNQFNHQMSNRIYTFLTYLLNKPAEEYSVMIEELSKNYPEAWALPNLDQSLMNAVAKSSPPSLPH